MRFRSVTAAVGAAVAATMTMAGPAAASCVGTQNEIAVCVDPTGGTLYENCVFLGDPTCTPVSVPGPVVWCEGDMAANCDPFH